MTCDGKPDAWAFIVLGEKYPSTPHESTTFTFLGYAAQPVCYEQHLPYFAGATHIGSETAEHEALLWSGLWRLALDADYPTSFLSDSKLAGDFAFGLCGTSDKNPGQLPRNLRGTFQALQTLLPDEALQLHHVKGRSGEIWNELCDHLAKHAANHTVWRRRHDIDLHVWSRLLPHLWMVFAPRRHGLPPLCNQGFIARPPELPTHDPERTLPC